MEAEPADGALHPYRQFETGPLLALAEAMAIALGEVVALRIDWAGLERGAAALARLTGFVQRELVPGIAWLRESDRQRLRRRIDRIVIRFAQPARARLLRCVDDALVVTLPPAGDDPHWCAATICRLLELDLDPDLAPRTAHLQGRLGYWQDRLAALGRRTVFRVDWVQCTGHRDTATAQAALRRLGRVVDGLGEALVARGGIAGLDEVVVEAALDLADGGIARTGGRCRCSVLAEHEAGVPIDFARAFAAE
jgi:hypothetical protein